MKRFVFRLARLERLRDRVRRESRARLALALGEQQRKSELREQAESSLGAALAEPLPPDLACRSEAWQQEAEWHEGLRRRIEGARTEERQAMGLTAEAASRHTSDARDHRVLQRLRDRRFHRWLHAAEFEEQKLQDEMHLLRLPAARTNEED